MKSWTENSKSLTGQKNENGEFRVTYRPQERKPVVEYLSAQKRFRHLKEEQINEIQEFVDNQCEELGI